MKFIRPIKRSDLPALVKMARGAGAGFTSLPPIPEFLRQKIELSEKSFAAKVKRPGHERYMFVLEDSDSGEVGGCCAVEAACGLDEPFYNYRVGTNVHASRELKVYNFVPTLYLSNDLTGTSVLCSLYLSPKFREGGTGRLLSKSRFMLMAGYTQRFAPKVIAEMRGISDAKGRSPFWEALGRHFFSIDYDRAEHLVGMGNKAFIAELMPKHAIYTLLLPARARAIIGKVHTHTAPAMHLLQQEGFRYQGYIDIFDGGPTVESPLSDIRTIERSRVVPARVGSRSDKSWTGTRHLIANAALKDFRCILGDLDAEADHALLNREQMKLLRLKPGAPVRISAL